MVKTFKITFDERVRENSVTYTRHYNFSRIETIMMHGRMLEFTDTDEQHYAFYLSKLINLQIEEEN